MEREVQVLRRDMGRLFERPRPVVRVGAYCRVSTELEAQQSSLDLQIMTFKAQIALHAGWVLADIYADDGVSGTLASRRTEFQRMIRDCRAGRIDYIITKSISRFARNTVECLSYVRELQSYGTQILFEKEKIDTGTPFSEMLLTILAAFAQEESRSLSENVKWGIRKRFEAGEARLKRMLGYGIADGQYVVIPEEAQTVKRIFELYETGRRSCAEIARIMERERRPNYSGRVCWNASRIHSILTNERYIGDVLMQKKYTEDHITHREIRNRDRAVPQYYVRDHHSPIISRKQFERCQKIAEIKNNHGRPLQYPYDTLLVCPICGHRLRQHEIRGHAGMGGWHCDRDEDSCRGYIVRTKLLDRAVLEAVNGLDAAALKAEGHDALAAFRKQHWKVRHVDYCWLDEYVDKITFGPGHALTVHWKCGLETTVRMRVPCDTFDPVKLAEMVWEERDT
ncbi:MAG: recombinase family protein [Clostridia bacterium]|nr:recombinase family protein [Clostridia bacterium]